MKTSIIKLDSYDNVYSIIDRMKWSQADRLLLVWPKRGHLIENEVEMSLIKRQAEESGAKIAVVSRSAGLAKLASDIGIPVFKSVPIAERAHWRNDSNQFIKNVDGEFLAKVQEKRFTQPKDQPRKRLQRINRVIAVGLSICAILALILFFIPSAKVIVYPQTKEKRITISVSASPDVKEVNINGNLPAFQKQVEVSGQISGTSTGSTNIPSTYATGKVEFSNLSNIAVKVPKGTIISTGGNADVRFVTQEDAEVPAFQSEPISVDVKALQEGGMGNLDAGALSVIEGSLGANISVTNSEPTSGGTDEKAPSPTEEDYQSAQAKLIEQLTAQIETEINQEGQQLIQGSLGVPVISSTVQSLEVGQPGQEFSLSLTVNFNGWVYSTSDLAELERAAMEASLDPGEMIFADSLQSSAISAPQISETAGSAKWQESVSAAVAPVVNQEKLIQDLQGKKITDAYGIIEHVYPSRKAPQIDTFPFFWKWIPLAPFQIRIKSE